MAEDRNAKARQEFELARQRKQFIDAFNSGQAGVRDRFGKLIEPGSLVIWFPPATGLIYQVKDVAPVLDPGAPAGIVRIMLTMDAPVNYRGGQVAQDMLVVSVPSEAAAAAAMGDAPIRLTEEQPMADRVAQRVDLDPDAEADAMPTADESPAADAPTTDNLGAGNNLDAEPERTPS